MVDASQEEAIVVYVDIYGRMRARSDVKAVIVIIRGAKEPIRTC